MFLHFSHRHILPTGLTFGCSGPTDVLMLDHFLIRNIILTELTLQWSSLTTGLMGIPFLFWQWNSTVPTVFLRVKLFLTLRKLYVMSFLVIDIVQLEASGAFFYVSAAISLVKVDLFFRKEFTAVGAWLAVDYRWLHCVFLNFYYFFV